MLSDSSLFYRCQVIALLNSCQNKFGLFDQFTWRKNSEGSAQSEEVYFIVWLNTSLTSCGVFIKNINYPKTQLFRPRCSGTFGSVNDNFFFSKSINNLPKTKIFLNAYPIKYCLHSLIIKQRNVFC